MPFKESSKFATVSKTVTATSAGASADVVYTVPLHHSSRIVFLHLANGTNSTKKAYVQYYDNSTTQYHSILNGLSMAGHTTHDVVQSNSIYLSPGDKIVAYIEAGMTLDLTVSAEEYYEPSR